VAPEQLKGEGGMKFLKGKMSERIQLRPYAVYDA